MEIDEHKYRIQLGMKLVINIVVVKLTKSEKIYLINSDIVNVYGRIFHPYGNNIIVLRMESQIGGCRRRWHESCHDLKFEHVSQLICTFDIGKKNQIK